MSPRYPRASPERIAQYRAAGCWDDRILADGVEAAAAQRPDAVATGVATLRAHGLGPGDGALLISGNTHHGVIAYHALLRAGATVVALDRRCGTSDVRTALAAVSGRVVAILPTAEVDRLGPTLTAVENTSDVRGSTDVENTPDVGGLTNDANLSDVEGPADVPNTSDVEQSADVGAVVDVAVVALEHFDVEHFGSTARQAPPVGWDEPDRNRTAVVLFSSGTTGRPKGVAHSLNTLTAGAANMARVTAADATTVEFLVSPLTSITGLMQVHLAADCHATLALEDHFDPEKTLARMADAGATLLGGAPVIAERLLRAATATGTGVTLTTLALGGAMLPRPLLEHAIDAFGIRIARVYGSSEAPNFTGSLTTDDRARRLADDGALQPGSQVRVGSARDAQEGLLRGPGMFLGYLDPTQHADAFEDGWYRSGDRVELHDGRLTVVGRLSENVNRNGLKISLDEIDVALTGLPGALEHATFALPDPATGERLAVAVTPADGATVTLAEVTAFLLARGTARRKLPEELVRWNGPLPRTASGKVVRSRLVMDSPGKDHDLAPRLRPTEVDR